MAGERLSERLDPREGAVLCLLALADEMPCTCAPDPALLGPLPFPPEVKSRILHFLLITTTCNRHFIDLLCVETAVYAVHAKELYREVTLDDDSIEAIWEGCDFGDDGELPDESVLEHLFDEDRTPLCRIPISHHPAVRKLLLVRHCLSLHLRTGDASDWQSGAVPKHLILMQKLGICIPLFCGVDNLIIGEDYMEHISDTLKADDSMSLGTPLGLIVELIPQNIPTVCIYWPDGAHDELGEELSSLLLSETLVCQEVTIHNAKPDQLPPILGPKVVLDLAPEVYHEGVGDEDEIGSNQEDTCMRWLSKIVKEVLQEEGDSLAPLDVTFTNLHTLKSSAPNSIVRYNTRMALGGDAWLDNLSSAISKVTVGADPESVQMEHVEIFYPATFGPRYCHYCASFVPQGDVELWT
ncbi:hypothetical protein B9479_004117 [Cryptococcus floricola]|uniref:Uncharacterized protein n=1 Tax=Cryptococcus floricola TaxID=2591691 RepID=A0A5D3AYM0_9TREE|nr:hypothetical protein B9479_004117 [Cryptococcus floricola]